MSGIIKERLVYAFLSRSAILNTPPLQAVHALPDGKIQIDSLTGNAQAINSLLAPAGSCTVRSLRFFGVTLSLGQDDAVIVRECDAQVCLNQSLCKVGSTRNAGGSFVEASEDEILKTTLADISALLLSFAQSRRVHCSRAVLQFLLPDRGLGTPAAGSSTSTLAVEAAHVTVHIDHAGPEDIDDGASLAVLTAESIKCSTSDSATADGTGNYHAVFCEVRGSSLGAHCIGEPTAEASAGKPGLRLEVTLDRDGTTRTGNVMLAACDVTLGISPSMASELFEFWKHWGGAVAGADACSRQQPTAVNTGQPDVAESAMGRPVASFNPQTRPLSNDEGGGGALAAVARIASAWWNGAGSVHGGDADDVAQVAASAEDDDDDGDDFVDADGIGAGFASAMGASYLASARQDADENEDVISGGTLHQTRCFLESLGVPVVDAHDLDDDAAAAEQGQPRSSLLTMHSQIGRPLHAEELSTLRPVLGAAGISDESGSDEEEERHNADFVDPIRSNSHPDNQPLQRQGARGSDDDEYEDLSASTTLQRMNQSQNIGRFSASSLGQPAGKSSGIGAAGRDSAAAVVPEAQAQPRQGQPRPIHVHVAVASITTALLSNAAAADVGAADPALHLSHRLQQLERTTLSLAAVNCALSQDGNSIAADSLTCRSFLLQDWKPASSASPSFGGVIGSIIVPFTLMEGHGVSAGTAPSGVAATSSYPSIDLDALRITLDLSRAGAVSQLVATWQPTLAAIVTARVPSSSAAATAFPDASASSIPGFPLGMTASKVSLAVVDGTTAGRHGESTGVLLRGEDVTYSLSSLDRRGFDLHGKAPLGFIYQAGSHAVSAKSLRLRLLRAAASDARLRHRDIAVAEANVSSAFSDSSVATADVQRLLFDRLTLSTTPADITAIGSWLDQATACSSQIATALHTAQSQAGLRVITDSDALQRPAAASPPAPIEVTANSVSWDLQTPDATTSLSAPNGLFLHSEYSQTKLHTGRIDYALAPSGKSVSNGSATESADTSLFRVAGVFDLKYSPSIVAAQTRDLRINLTPAWVDAITVFQQFAPPTPSPQHGTDVGAPSLASQLQSYDLVFDESSIHLPGDLVAEISHVRWMADYLVGPEASSLQAMVVESSFAKLHQHLRPSTAVLRPRTSNHHPPLKLLAFDSVAAAYLPTFQSPEASTSSSNVGVTPHVHSDAHRSAQASAWNILLGHLDVEVDLRAATETAHAARSCFDTLRRLCGHIAVDVDGTQSRQTTAPEIVHQHRQLIQQSQIDEFYFKRPTPAELLADAYSRSQTGRMRFDPRTGYFIGDGYSAMDEFAALDDWMASDGATPPVAAGFDLLDVEDVPDAAPQCDRGAPGTLPLQDSNPVGRQRDSSFMEVSSMRSGIQTGLLQLAERCESQPRHAHDGIAPQAEVPPHRAAEYSNASTAPTACELRARSVARHVARIMEHSGLQPSAVADAISNSHHQPPVSQVLLTARRIGLNIHGGSDALSGHVTATASDVSFAMSCEQHAQTAGARAVVVTDPSPIAPAFEPVFVTHTSIGVLNVIDALEYVHHRHHSNPVGAPVTALSIQGRRGTAEAGIRIEASCCRYPQLAALGASSTGLDAQEAPPPSQGWLTTFTVADSQLDVRGRMVEWGLDVSNSNVVTDSMQAFKRDFSEHGADVDAADASSAPFYQRISVCPVQLSLSFTPEGSVRAVQMLRDGSWSLAGRPDASRRHVTSAADDNAPAGGRRAGASGYVRLVPVRHLPLQFQPLSLSCVSGTGEAAASIAATYARQLADESVHLVLAAVPSAIAHPMHRAASAAGAAAGSIRRFVQNAAQQSPILSGQSGYGSPPVSGRRHAVAAATGAVVMSARAVRPVVRAAATAAQAVASETVDSFQQGLQALMADQASAGEDGDERGIRQQHHDHRHSDRADSDEDSSDEGEDDFVVAGVRPQHAATERRNATMMHVVTTVASAVSLYASVGVTGAVGALLSAAGGRILATMLETTPEGQHVQAVLSLVGARVVGAVRSMMQPPAAAVARARAMIEDDDHPESSIPPPPSAHWPPDRRHSQQQRPPRHPGQEQAVPAFSPILTSRGSISNAAGSVNRSVGAVPLPTARPWTAAAPTNVSSRYPISTPTRSLQRNEQLQMPPRAGTGASTTGYDDDDDWEAL